MYISFLTVCLQAQQYPGACGTGKIQGALAARTGIQPGYESYIHLKNKSSSAEDAKYIVPVVVHIVHQNGVENISDTQVMSQIIALNNDYRRMPATKGHGTGADTQIEFALATKNPSGNPTTGITRTVSSLTNLPYLIQDTALKTLIGWPRDMYLNVWIVKIIDNGNTIGYAFYPPTMNDPFAANDILDGIIIEYDFWGTTGILWPGYEMGATATHEVGHWLGLYHTFEPWPGPDGCSCFNCVTCGDMICDTPPTQWENYGNPGRQNTCTNDSPDRVDQTRNYMDYVDDAHMDMYTDGQRVRAHFFMDNDSFRNNLYTGANQLATGTGKYGPLTADFHTNRTTTCTGGQVRFSEYTMNIPTQWEWSFPGGNPTTSNDTIPVITYPNSGSYDVTLIVSNSVSSDTITKTAYINITDTIYQVPFSEGFESGTFPPIDWTLEDPDSTSPDSRSWQPNASNGAFGNSSGSAFLNHYVYKMYGQLDGLVLPKVNLSNSQNSKVTFSVAYRPYDLQFWLDTLRIWVSDDCGTTWAMLYEKGGEELGTYTALTGSFFIPQNNEWRTDTVSLATYDGQIIQLKFESKNHYGNCLYIDDVLINGWPVGMEDEAEHFAISVFPNPTKGKLNLNFSSLMPQPFNVVISDITGRVLYRRQSLKIQHGNADFSIGSQEFTNHSGVFFLHVECEGRMDTRKIIVIN
ncbi:choice-of-anchor J domain-containing protein [Bacteroidales bacterium AH-315-I05]|nr:choice-of-anchor J domain-containing protein [Bacteroidales bacterium AH-315-I05]